MNNDSKLSITQTLSQEARANEISPDTFEQYQRLMEKTISEMSAQINDLEQKLNVFTNLLEISQYINKYIKSQDLFPLINDMLIGVFGAKYSTIYIKSDNKYIPVTPPSFSYPHIEEEKALISEHHEDKFILNSDVSIYKSCEEKDAVYSCLGVPIKINSNPLGFMIIQHQQKKYFTTQHATFLFSLANHVGVAIENNILYNQIKESASKDGLTNIFNKKYFFDTLNAIPNLIDLNYALVMIDIDDFKKVNDTYGHLYGDKVLIAVSKIIKNSIRPMDIVARYGGEEIIIFFSNFVDYNLLYSRLNDLRRKIEETKISGDDFTSSVTASFGCYIKKDICLSLNEVIQKADDNLYTCKRTGKNKVIINDL